MYGCGCADCYGLCGYSYCDGLAQNPSSACLHCMKNLVGVTKSCVDEYTKCHETSCDEYRDCVYECF
jgi:hypothetical protein